MGAPYGKKRYFGVPQEWGDFGQRQEEEDRLVKLVVVGRRSGGYRPLSDSKSVSHRKQASRGDLTIRDTEPQ
jgi:hypothetical protein